MIQLAVIREESVGVGCDRVAKGLYLTNKSCILPVLHGDRATMRDLPA